MGAHMGHFGHIWRRGTGHRPSPGRRQNVTLTSLEQALVDPAAHTR
jgi:hypothetical protein